MYPRVVPSKSCPVWLVYRPWGEPKAQTDQPDQTAHEPELSPPQWTHTSPTKSVSMFRWYSSMHEWFGIARHRLPRPIPWTKRIWALFATRLFSLKLNFLAKLRRFPASSKLFVACGIYNLMLTNEAAWMKRGLSDMSTCDISPIPPHSSSRKELR